MENLNDSIQVQEMVEKIVACAKCGAPLQGEQAFCPKCGQKVGVELQNSKKKMLVGLLAAIAVVIIAVIIIATSAPNFEKVYKDMGLSRYLKLSDDKKSLTADTNPNDVKDYFIKDAWDKVLEVNKKLGLPDSLAEKFNNTRAMDGRQTQTFGKITVSWTYHPNNGLEVIYEKK